MYFGQSVDLPKISINQDLHFIVDLGLKYLF